MYYTTDFGIVKRDHTPLSPGGWPGDAQLQVVWLGKNDDEEALKNAFERNKREGLLGLDELHRTWGQLSEIGSHATLHSMCDRFAITQAEDGGRTLRLNYSGIDWRIWGMSLFSMLSTCCTVEQIFFTDYEGRLTLDHVLVRMRGEVESDKEQLREVLKVRYDVEPPTPRS